MYENDPKITLAFAIDYFKTKAELARELKLSRATITEWTTKHNYKYLPAIYAYRLVNKYTAFKKENKAEKVRIKSGENI